MSEIIFNLNFPSGEKIEVQKDMARLYTHLGNYAVYDHVFIVTDEEEATGIYLWAQIPPDNPVYNKIAPVVVENECEMHQYVRKPMETDINAFEKHASTDEDEIPSWLPPLT